MTLFGIKDNFADTRAKYKDIVLFSTDTTIYNIPKEYINTYKSFKHTYYFTDYNIARLFETSLWHKYNKK